MPPMTSRRPGARVTITSSCARPTFALRFEVTKFTSYYAPHAICTSASCVQFQHRCYVCRLCYDNPTLCPPVMPICCCHPQASEPTPSHCSASCAPAPGCLRRSGHLCPSAALSSQGQRGHSLGRRRASQRKSPRAARSSGTSAAGAAPSAGRGSSSSASVCRNSTCTGSGWAQVSAGTQRWPTALQPWANCAGRSAEGA